MRSKHDIAAPRAKGLLSMNVHSPFDLQGLPSDLAVLSKGLISFASPASGNPTWLKREDGTLWVLSVDQRDLEHKFEVFTLRVEQAASIFRFALPAPSEFRPWPFDNWRVDVLRRAEYIFKPEDPGPTFGVDPLGQDAARPGEVPRVALSSCVVAAGLLFTGADQQRLLICVDWMPFNMVVTQEPTVVNDLIEACEFVSVDDYAQQLAMSVQD
jgi:hypothetical protein